MLIKEFILALLSPIILLSGILGFSSEKPQESQNLASESLGASVLHVYQGGTGASTFASGECLVGNGANPITTQACGGAASTVGALGDLSDVATSTASTGDVLVLQSDGTFDLAAQTGGGISNWSSNGEYVTPTSSVGIFVTASSTIQSHLRVDGNASTTQGLTVAGTIWGNLTGTASFANALSANGGNCSVGNAPLGVDAVGAVESCFDVWTEAENTAAAYISDLSGFDTDDLTEGSNLYYTDIRAGDYIDASSTVQTYFSNAATAFSWGNHALQNYFDKDSDYGVQTTWSGYNFFTSGMSFGNASGTSVTTTDTLYVGGYASSTGGLFTQGNLHVGGTASFDGVISGLGFTTAWATEANATSTTDSDNTWTLHDSYPAACAGGQFVTAVGDTLTCDTPAGSGISNWQVASGALTPTSTTWGLLVNNASSTITNLVVPDSLSGAGFNNAFDTRLNATTTLDLTTLLATNFDSSNVTITGGTITGITDLTVSDGGTGVSTLTDGGILLGSGTGAITALGVAANGQIPIGDGTTDPVLATISEGNYIDIANGAGSISIAVDPTELSGATWSAGGSSNFTWTYNLSGTDPALVFSSGAVGVTGTASSTVGLSVNGNFVVNDTGNTTSTTMVVGSDSDTATSTLIIGNNDTTNKGCLELEGADGTYRAYINAGAWVIESGACK